MLFKKKEKEPEIFNPSLKCNNRDLLLGKMLRMNRGDKDYDLFVTLVVHSILQYAEIKKISILTVNNRYIRRDLDSETIQVDSVNTLEGFNSKNLDEYDLIIFHDMTCVPENIIPSINKKRLPYQTFIFFFEKDDYYKRFFVFDELFTHVYKELIVPPEELDKENDSELINKCPVFLVAEEEKGKHDIIGPPISLDEYRTLYNLGGTNIERKAN